MTKLLTFPLQAERDGSKSKNVYLICPYGFAFSDLQSLRASQVETNSKEKRYIRKARQKTDVESLIPRYIRIVELIISLYTKEKSKGDYKVFPDTMSKGKLNYSPQSRKIGV
ncbi:site-specific integrase [Porphyromonas crevioricanis]|uniref:integrase n=1 Tax=Porphyromonas crevioricanis TaxID=393921 RepID=UPI00035487E0|nr:integrase [Porphyromonas crevioricanis]GAD06728.1 integrase [Porphyromonas crevioricanis JCM 13913]